MIRGHIESKKENTNVVEFKDGDKLSSYKEASQKNEWNKVMEEWILTLE